MFEQDLRLTMPDGTADAVLFSPDPSSPLPGVLHLPDIGSIREAHRKRVVWAGLMDGCQSYVST
jgi:dienelactone hydrolase